MLEDLCICITYRGEEICSSSMTSDGIGAGDVWLSKVEEEEWEET